MPKQKISWENLNKKSIILAEKIKEFRPVKIYGIPRGGLIPATIISYYLDIPLITILPIKFEENIIIIDEICDSSKTISNYIEKNKEEYAKGFMKFGTIFVNSNNCKNYPNYFVKRTRNWLIFPYDQEKDTISKIQCQQ